MRNDRCYSCKVQLESDNVSVEHIIPNAFGGRLKSNKLLCKKCNNIFGLGIDFELNKQILLGSMMNVPRERGQAQNLNATNLNGKKVSFDPINRIVEAKASKPREFIDVDGQLTYEVEGTKAIKEFLKARRKEYPHLTNEQFEKKVTHFSNPHEEVSIPDGHGFKPLTDPDSYRAIAKIAVNYYVHITTEFSLIEEAIKFIKGDDLNKKIIVFNNYKQTRDELGLELNETSHIIYLKGNYSERILYCYVELFNVYNFIIILNEDYNGRDLDQQYRFDLNHQILIDDQIKLDLKAVEIKKLVFPGMNINQGFGDRLFAFSKINNIRMVNLTNKVNSGEIPFSEIEARAKSNISKGFNGKAIIAFIDILGFSNEIISNWKKDSDPLFRIMKLKAYWDILNEKKIPMKLLDYDYETILLETKYPTVISFSDSFIFILPVDENSPTTILPSILTVSFSILEIWRNCIDEGFTIRGGLDYDDIFHNGLDLVGPGLISTYILESKFAKISRIIISDKIKTIIDQHLDNIHETLRDYFLRYFKTDIDSRIIINPAMIPEPARGNAIELLSQIMSQLKDHDSLNKYFDLFSRLDKNDRSLESRDMYK